MDFVVYDEEDRRFVPAWLLLLLAVVAGLLAAGMVLLALRNSEGAAAPQAGPQASSAARGVGTAAPQAGTQDLKACADALQRGDDALARAAKLSGELEAHTMVLDDLLAKRATADQVVGRSLPILTEAATDRQRFAEELTAYKRSRQAC